MRSSMSEIERTGVSALLTVNADTRVMRRFLGNMPEQYGAISTPEDLHITMMDYTETLVDVFSDRDLIALRNTSRAANEYLSGQPLNRVTVHPAQAQLGEFGKFLGIEVEYDPYLEDIRGKLGEIASEEAGVKLSNRDFVPHISVAHKFVKRRRSQPILAPAAPTDIHLDGYFVGQRTLKDQTGRRPHQPYRNLGASGRSRRRR